MKLTKRQLRRLTNETIFVDPKGRAVDLTSDRFDPKERRRQERIKVLNHPNQVIADRATRAYTTSRGHGYINDEGEYVKPTADERDQAKKEIDFLINMSHHPNEKIRNAFNSELIKDVNQAISIGEVEMFAPPEYTPPPMTDDEQYEQGIYDEFDTPGGYGDHNYPIYDTAEARRDYSREYEIIKKRMHKVLKAFKGANPERHQEWVTGEDQFSDYPYDMERAARGTPGWQQLVDKLEDYENPWGQDLARLPEDLAKIYLAPTSPSIQVNQPIDDDILDPVNEGKITRRQLRKLINETIFAGGPTVDSPDKSVGVTVDMAKQIPPLYRPQRDRDEEIRRTAPQTVVDMLDTGIPRDQEFARSLASGLDGKPEAYETLTPEEREAQSLYDEFYPSDIFDDHEHDMSDDRLQRSYAPEIQQIRNAMKKRIEAAIDRGDSSYDELFSAAYSTPGYDNLRKHIMQLPPSEFSGATGMHGDAPSDELMYMPGQLIDMYMADDNPHY